MRYELTAFLRAVTLVVVPETSKDNFFLIFRVKRSKNIFLRLLYIEDISICQHVEGVNNLL
jgi:hypothetical protein